MLEQNICWFHEWLNEAHKSCCVPYSFFCFSSVQLLSCVRLFVTPWNAARQVSLSISNLQFAQTHVHLVTSSSVVPFSCFQSFPASGSFPMSQFFASGGQSVGASVSASVLPMNIQGWFPSGLTGLTFLLLLFAYVLSHVHNVRVSLYPSQVYRFVWKTFRKWKSLFHGKACLQYFPAELVNRIVSKL